MSKRAEIATPANMAQRARNDVTHHSALSPQSFSGESGQMMMIAVFLMLLMVLTVPVVVWMNSQAGLQSVRVQKVQEARQAAQQAIAYAASGLQTDWPSALAGHFPPVCLSTEPYTTHKGMQFLIQCSTGAPAQSYQVRVVAKALLANSERVTGLQALLSQTTLGATMANNISASAALVSQTYTLGGGLGALDVHWGPIVSYPSETWNLTSFDPIDSNRYPRKFAVGGITGPHHARSEPHSSQPITDGKEYWAYQALGFPPFVDEEFYIDQVASIATGITAPTCTGGADCTASPPGSGYFYHVSSNTANFDLPTGYSVPASTAIYIYGNASFGQIKIDLKKPAFNPNSAFIVTGDLTLNGPTFGQTLTDLHVPPTANLEYPYATSYPCSSVVTPGSSGTCRSDQTGLTRSQVDFRGFLFVKGNLVVTTGNWVLAGVVRVDGQVIIQNGARLTILYDDEINHGIHTYPFELQTDSLQDAPPS